MNKTLLLILVDFLLLTLLSMTKWDEETAAASVGSAVDSPATSSLAMMEQDMLDTLETSLDEERSLQKDMSEAMLKREEELAQKEKALLDAQNQVQARGDQVATLEKDLQRKDHNLKTVETMVADLTVESKALRDDVQEANRTIDTVQRNYLDLELEAKRSQAQSRELQAELQSKLAEISEKEAALKQVEAEKNEAARVAQELGVQVRLVEEEKKYLRENLDTLKEEVEVVREEKQVLQAQTGLLAEGVTQLAEQSEGIKEEIRLNTPINANQLFNQFLGNQVATTYTSQIYDRGRVIEKVDEVKTLLVSDGNSVVALTHVDRTPMRISSSVESFRRLNASFGTNGQSEEIGAIGFLALDPRLSAVAVSDEQVEAFGVKTYLTAIDPYKFEQAVLIDARGRYYGEVEFKLDPRTPGYVKMQSKIMSRVFGDFSPSVGDLVLSKTGELLGVMIDRSYCLVIDALIFEENLRLGSGFSQDDYRKTVGELKARYDLLPSRAR